VVDALFQFSDVFGRDSDAFFGGFDVGFFARLGIDYLFLLFCVCLIWTYETNAVAVRDCDFCDLEIFGDVVEGFHRREVVWSL